MARTSTVSITLRTATVQNVSVRYSSTGGSVPFSYSDFYYSHTSVQTSSYITFGTPSNGSLTAGGSAVSTSTRFSFTGSNSNGYQSISTVTYTPASGYNGTATIPFVAYNSSNQTVHHRHPACPARDAVHQLLGCSQELQHQLVL